MRPVTQDPAIERNKPAQAWATMAVGAVLHLCGITLLVFLVWFGYPLAILGKTPELAVFVIAGVTAAITAFCLLVGYRLVFNRPNRHGSLLSPFGWKLLGSVFALFAIGTAAVLLWTAQYVELVGSVCAGMFASWCFRAAKAARANIV